MISTEQHIDSIVQRVIHQIVELGNLNTDLWFGGHSPVGMAKLWSVLQAILDDRKRHQVGFRLRPLWRIS